MRFVMVRVRIRDCLLASASKPVTRNCPCSATKCAAGTAATRTDNASTGRRIPSQESEVETCTRSHHGKAVLPHSLRNYASGSNLCFSLFVVQFRWDKKDIVTSVKRISSFVVFAKTLFAQSHRDPCC